jgi:pilus assembly protein CpaF
MLDELHARVRSALLDAGIDPMENLPGVRAVIDECLVDSGLADMTGEVHRQLMAAFTGYGRLQSLFDDPGVEEIWVNEPGRVFIAREGRSELTTIVLGDGEIRDLVERMLRASGRRLDLSNPFVDAMLSDGSRLHVVIPDITRAHWSVNIRRFVVRAAHVDELVQLGTLTTQAANFLEAAVISGLNVIVAGGTQAGKTTMLNALLGCVPSHERLISCEEVFEIRTAHPDWVAMQTRDASLEGTGEVSLRRLVREALRMRPTRLIVGEVRQAEALDLLVAMNSGMPSMATLHANSAREAVTKLCTLPLLAGQNIPGDFVVPTVAGSVDLVVHVATLASGRRVVREISALSGRAEQGVIELAEIFSDRGAGLERRGGFPPHAERFANAGFDLTRLLSDPDARMRAA